MRRGSRGPAAPRDRGAALVEFALLSTVLVPLVLGVLQYGYYFWQLQKVPVLAPNINQSSLIGTYCTGTLPQLVSRVESLALTSVQNLDAAAGLPISASNITATVVNYVPGNLGVDVKISVAVPVVESVVAGIPLPNDGNVTNDVFVRLDNVRVTTGSC